MSLPFERGRTAGKGASVDGRQVAALVFVHFDATLRRDEVTIRGETGKLTLLVVEPIVSPQFVETLASGRTSVTGEVVGEFAVN